MTDDPAWLAAFRQRLHARFAASPWSVPLLLRVSDAERAWQIQLPDRGGAAVDQRPLRIASVTKVYVAAALFRLAEHARINLDAPLADVVAADTAEQLRGGGYDPAAITVSQVMRHISGLRDHCFSNLFLDPMRADPDRRWTRAEQIGIAMRLGPPLAPPGAAFVYSDTGYVILGEVVERASECGLADAVPQLLQFAALGLSETEWDRSGRDAATIEQQYLGDHASSRWDASFDLFGGGGIVATLADVDRFLRALLGGRVFEREETLRAIFADLSTPSDPGFVHNGLMFRGPLDGEDVWAHTGFWGVQAAMLPGRGLALVAAFNRAPEEGAYGKDDLLVDFAAAVSEAE